MVGSDVAYFGRLADTRPASGRLPRMEHGGANHQSCSGSPRHRDRQRRVRWDGGLESHPEGHRRAAARCGRQIRSVEVLDPRAALGSPGTRSAGREAARVLSRYQGTALRDAGGPPVRAHARVGAWRQDECLGPCQPAVFADGPQGGRAGRVGDPVADRLPGDCPLLRSGRAADRRVRRHRRLGGAAGQQVPAAAAGAAVWRAVADEGHDEARAASRGRAAREHDPPDPWVSGVPLLRELRRRLRYGVVLLLRGSSPAVRAEDRASHDSVQRGRGADPDRRRRSGARRPVLRSSDRRRASGAGQGRRGRSELRRFDAHPAELEVVAPSEWTGQRVGRHRPLPVRADQAQPHRLLPAARGHADAKRSRHRRRAHLHDPLQSSGRKEARLPPRIRRAVLEHRGQHLRCALWLGGDTRFRRVA